MRPPLKSTDPGYELIPQRLQRPALQVVSPTSLAVDSPQGRKLFVFDRVFGEDVYQDGVWEYLSESVNSFVQGYNVSVLAYGQSGAGKSYTMGTSGIAEQNDPQIMGMSRHSWFSNRSIRVGCTNINLPGVIPRAAGVLFEKLADPTVLRRNGLSNLKTPTRYSTSFTHGPQTLGRANDDRNWQMKATYVEVCFLWPVISALPSVADCSSKIYNEQLRDLLAADLVPQGERTTVAIREDAKGRILLTGLHQVEIKSMDDLLRALNFGSSIRQTDATVINAKSSRSHAVFSISLVQRRNRVQPGLIHDKRHSVPLEAMNASDNWVTIDSKLHFVDLAGSERLKNTGASGDRAKEGISINVGLASLGKVISQLSLRHPGSHVSYRDSKLTRLLQDSLGGNAITYMIACVTSAEFYLSETLNTVQYAQRARAIQSKPQIQQVSDESDKQALIDRLRAEISFLRDQIRSSETGDRLGNAPQERAERQNGREIELQNDLIDARENYTALSQRHAKLISEITMVRHQELAESPPLPDVLGDSAVERLQRSNSFAEAVEQVVLEYEKTIQSLETSLSKTRSSLSATESSLLEKEAKCAYVETVSQQLQNRVQKMIDRESSTEIYLRDLESKLDGHSFGEEKSSIIITELRKEIARIRESEASCEEYISTLEQRLAETDQSMEFMQQEVDRLEHVVERQRSLGKLDNLLYEFGNIQRHESALDEIPPYKTLTNGPSQFRPESSHKNRNGSFILRDTTNTTMLETEDGDAGIISPTRSDVNPRTPDHTDDHVRSDRNAGVSSPDFQQQQEFVVVPSQREISPRSSAHSELQAERLNAVARELFDLQVDHKATVNDYDILNAKYEQALQALSELQSPTHHPIVAPASVTPASSRPTSSLVDDTADEMTGEVIPSLRSLSSELCLAGDSTSPSEPISVEASHRKATGSHEQDPKSEALSREIEKLKKAQAEQDSSLIAWNRKYSQLQEIHNETLNLVEELKAEVQKAKLTNPSSPNPPLIRRKGSQMNDRAHRSLASLRKIAVENFADKPDAMQSFETNISTTMHELHQRSERVQVLEAELLISKKEMESKTTMISGLARERSSLGIPSPMNISMVSSIHEQLLQTENQMKLMQENHAAREHELITELASLRSLASCQSEGTPSAQPAYVETRNVLQELEDERTKNTNILTEMNSKLDEDKVMITAHAQRILELELLYNSARHEIEEAMLYKIDSKAYLDSLRDQVGSLDRQLEDHQSMVESQACGLRSLQESHAQALESMQSTRSMVEGQLRSQAEEAEKKHREKEETLLNSIEAAHQQLKGLIDFPDDKGEISLSSNDQSIFGLVTSIRDRLSQYRKDKLNADLRLSELEAEVLRIKTSHQENFKELQRVTEERDKYIRVVEELEDQLSLRYDQQRATSSRFSMFSSNREQALQDGNTAKAKLDQEVEIHRARASQLEVYI